MPSVRGKDVPGSRDDIVGTWWQGASKAIVDNGSDLPFIVSNDEVTEPRERAIIIGGITSATQVEIDFIKNNVRALHPVQITRLNNFYVFSQLG